MSIWSSLGRSFKRFQEYCIIEMCGIAGISLDGCSSDLIPNLIRMLISLQHRGQESAGISCLSNGELCTFKNFGMVVDALRAVEVKSYSSGIGHVRYSTSGSKKNFDEIQPMTFKVNGLNFSLAFNGNVVNHYIVRREFLKDYKFRTNTDTETIGALIVKLYREYKDMVEVLKECIDILDGAFSILLLTSEGTMYVIRDVLGFKPLCYAYIDNGIAFASESAALDILEGYELQDVKPGEVLVVHRGEIVERTCINGIGRRAFCMFEFVYFARPDSIIEGRLVHNVRKELGRRLYRLAPTRADLVVPVPDSGKSIALGYAEESGISFEEAIMKNRYVGRSFIMPDEKTRIETINLKFNIVEKLVRDKDIILIDDSIVRGSTLRKLVPKMKSKGARKVHVRIGCPPIIKPCFMGIDFPTSRELIASDRSVEKVREIINADSLIYNTIKNLCESIGYSENELCLACLTGKYPLKFKYAEEELEKIFGSR